MHLTLIRGPKLSLCSVDEAELLGPYLIIQNERLLVSVYILFSCKSQVVTLYKDVPVLRSVRNLLEI